MKTRAQRIGARGERLAARYLRRTGYRILAKNKHCGRNELDLVVKNKQFIVFVEVKTRTVKSDTVNPDRPALAVDRDKRKRTVAAALSYLKEKKSPLCPRFDVIEVYLDGDAPKKLLRLNHISDAFGVNGNVRR